MKREIKTAKETQVCLGRETQHHYVSIPAGFRSVFSFPLTSTTLQPGPDRLLGSSCEINRTFSKTYLLKESIFCTEESV